MRPRLVDVEHEEHRGWLRAIISQAISETYFHIIDLSCDAAAKTSVIARALILRETAKRLIRHKVSIDSYA